MSDGTGGHMDGRGRHLAGRASASSTAEPVWDRGSGVWHCQDKFPGLDAGQQIGRYSRRTPCLLPARWLSAVSAVGPGRVVDKPHFSRICRVTARAALLLWHITDLPVSLKRERSPCPDASPGMDGVKSTSLSTWAGLLEGSWGVGTRWLTGTVTEAHTHTMPLSDGAAWNRERAGWRINLSPNPREPAPSVGRGGLQDGSRHGQQHTDATHRGTASWQS